MTASSGMLRRFVHNDISLQSYIIDAMQPDIFQKVDALEKKIDAIYVSVEKTRKLFLWTTIVTVAIFVLPLIALGFILPSFLGNYVGQINSLTQQMGAQ